MEGDRKNLRSPSIEMSAKRFRLETPLGAEEHGPG